MGEYTHFLDAHAADIATFKDRQQSAFDAERERWRASGQAEYVPELPDALAATDAEFEIPAGCSAVASAVTGNVWQVSVAVGERFTRGAPLVVVEAMKMEVPIEAEQDGEVVEVLCGAGAAVTAGQVLVVVRYADG